MTFPLCEQGGKISRSFLVSKFHLPLVGSLPISWELVFVCVERRAVLCDILNTKTIFPSKLHVVN